MQVEPPQESSHVKGGSGKHLSKILQPEQREIWDAFLASGLFHTYQLSG